MVKKSFNSAPAARNEFNREMFLLVYSSGLQLTDYFPDPSLTNLRFTDNCLFYIILILLFCTFKKLLLGDSINIPPKARKAPLSG